MSARWRTLAIWIFLIVLFVVFYEAFSGSPRTPSLPGGQEGNTTSWGQGLVSWVPLLAMAALFLFFLARMKGGPNLFALRKSTARLLSSPPDVTFARVGGNAEAKQRLRDLVDFLRNPKRWETAGARLPTGVLLEGPPGCGKTLLARAVAGEAKVAFFEVSASEFVEMFAGVGAARIRDLFEQAAKKAPVVIFIDELDAIGRRRGGGAYNATHQEREQALNQLLVSLDGFQKRKGVVVLAATNRSDVLDAALLRPGRFDLRLRVEPLDREARAETLKIHLQGKPLGDVDVASLAERTAGFTGAEIAHLVNEAATAAVRRAGASAGKDLRIESADFDATIDAHARRAIRLDQLDVALTESALQWVQPQGRVVLRATTEDGATVSGELLWADPHFLKLKPAGAPAVLLAKRGLSSIEALDGTDPATAEEVPADRWARIKPDAA